MRTSKLIGAAGERAYFGALNINKRGDDYAMKMDIGLIRYPTE
jgi:hypothetical protein